MSSYEAFDRLAVLVTYGGGFAALAFFIERARTGTWRSRSTRSLAALLFFLIPAGALLRLLSRPLTEQSAHSGWLQVGLVLIWLAAGAAAAFRSLRPAEHRVDPPIT
jgi:hypothetical protein